MRASTLTALFVLLLGLGLPASSLAAQTQTARPANAEGLHLSREDLQALLAQLESTATSSSASRDARQQAQASAARIRQRLREGDFRAGDRIMLDVRREPEMSGEFTVEPGRTITVPEIGAISLEGVLRSELAAHMQQELGRYLQNPVVQARSLIRVAVLGEVGSPGFFTLPASLILEDVVMEAGGPTRNANLDGIRVERGGETIWGGAALRQAMLDSRTLDQLSLQAGDQIVVPEKGTSLLSLRGLLTIVTTAGSLVYLYTRIRR